MPNRKKQPFTHLLNDEDIKCYIVPTAVARHNVPRDCYAIRTEQGEELVVHKSDIARLEAS